MNWKKLLTFLVAAPISAGLGAYASNPSQPFNFHTVGIPALATLGVTLSALFVTPPHTDTK